MKDVNGDGKSELEGIKAAAYIANELDKGTSLDDLIIEFGDERCVSLRIAFIRYHNWIARDFSGRWHLGKKGRFWVKRLLGFFSGISPIPLLNSLEQASLVMNIPSIV